jgi:hypothetical protein
MPLLRFDLFEGRTDAELKTLLDAAHEAMVEAFGVPPRDRYQIVTEHKPSRMIIEDTGLGIPRTDKAVFLQMTTRPRPVEQKTLFYKLLSERLKQKCDIEPSDVVISCVVNADDDWSFGHGRAQFLTREL